LTPLLGFIAPQRIRLSILSNKWDTALPSSIDQTCIEWRWGGNTEEDSVSLHWGGKQCGRSMTAAETDLCPLPREAGETV